MNRNDSYEERFAVSHVGMREMHAARPPWSLVKELVQNVWDEAPEAACCAVTVSERDNGAVCLTVADDGPGFANVSDAWTLLGNTEKRRDPKKRGRFNLGEKEIISIASRARIATVGCTIDFPETGGRFVTPNDRDRGTVIEMTLPWDRQQAQELVRRLESFRPPADCALTVNGRTVPTAAADHVVHVPMPTVLQDGPGEPMRRTVRKTEIRLAQPRDAGQSWLYEMGIPVQPIQGPWDIDVQQKIPMPPNRDTVADSYLRDLYAEALNITHQVIDKDEFGNDWVKAAVADERTTADAIRSVVRNRYGSKPALTSNSVNANLSAAEAGHELINPRSLSAKERKKFRELAGVQTTTQLFPTPELSFVDPRYILPESEFPEFRQWVVQMAAYADIRPTVVIMDDPRANLGACCTASSATPTVSFNIRCLGREFFQPPFGSADRLTLLIHELGHAMQDKPMAHGPSWGEGVATVAGRISAHLLRGAN